ncbi:MAG: hypothetical protein ABIZ80_04960 [Bryobacteraceae bacterium]
MPQLFYILFGAAFTVAVSTAFGKLLFGRWKLPVYREEHHLFAFVTGSACLSLLTFLLCAAHVARKSVFLWTGIAILAAAWWKRDRTARDPLPPLPAFWKWLFAVVFSWYGVYYLAHAMAPELSPDGTTYHLGLVARYLRAHGFDGNTTNMYANLSQGFEMLFLFAFAFGKHSAAAMVHFAFLIALPLAMVCYGRRMGFPVAGVCGALMFFLSPIVGLDGISAYNDVATACILFTLFYLLQIWAGCRAASLVMPVGVLAGFAYGVKYTAFLAVPYALAMVAWHSVRNKERWLRPVLTIGGIALIFILPWMIKNWIFVHNPVSPFFNAWFPNPFIHISFEKDYVRSMQHYEGIASLWQIPLELTYRGGLLVGFNGPMFLLAPLGLLALRLRAGRQLLLAAAVFGLTYATNIGSRFLIPALPYLSLALALTVSEWKPAAALLVLAHAITVYPPVIGRYCVPSAWRLDGFPWRAALRIESEDRFLNRRLYYYGTARMIEKLTPPGSRIFSFGQAPESYTTREIVVAYQSAFGNLLGDILWTPMIPDYLPKWYLRFRFPAEPLRAVRVVQTARAEPDQWSVGEMRIFRGAKELERAPEWRLRASPNPWDVQLAFDNSPVTRWRSWQTIYPGMSLAVDFGKPEAIDSVLLEAAHDQYKIKVRLEGQTGGGNWKPLSAAPESAEAAVDAGYRRGAVEELKARGITHLLVFPADFGAADFRNRGNAWGITMLGEHNGSVLYSLD